MDAGAKEDGIEVHGDDLVPVLIAQLAHLGGAAADTCVVDAVLQRAMALAALMELTVARAASAFSHVFSEPIMRRKLPHLGNARTYSPVIETMRRRTIFAPSSRPSIFCTSSFSVSTRWRGAM